MQVEAQFCLRYVTSQETKYLPVVSSLPVDVAKNLADILTTPEPANPFDHLKAAIIERKFESKRSRKQQHLTSDDVGNRRPSQLFIRMSQLLSDQDQNPNSHLLRDLFLQHLPQT